METDKEAFDGITTNNPSGIRSPPSEGVIRGKLKVCTLDVPIRKGGAQTSAFRPPWQKRDSSGKYQPKLLLWMVYNRSKRETHINNLSESCSRSSRKVGFTLIELLVVIGII